MGVSPMEYAIFAFPENRFTGEIAEEIGALVSQGTIGIVDLLFVSVGEDGTVVQLEVDEHEHLTAFAQLEGEVGGAIGPDDIEHVAAAIERGSSALVVVWEHLWAGPLAAALDRAGGVLVEGARIPRELVDDLDAELAAAG